MYVVVTAAITMLLRYFEFYRIKFLTMYMFTCNLLASFAQVELPHDKLRPSLVLPTNGVATQGLGHLRGVQPLGNAPKSTKSYS
jgi:hypothetical protein